MNAMTVAKTEFSDHIHVILGGDSEMDPQFAGIDAHIAHINQGIADIKTEQRRIDDKFDKKFDDMTPRLDVLRDKVETSTAAVSKRIDDTHASLTNRLEDAGERLESVRKEVTAQIEDVRKDVSSRLENVRSELTLRIDHVYAEVGVVKESVAAIKFWALRFFVAQAAALLLIIAHGFRWL
jgi:tetrahydromethanopterin S-methyltransferase subunit G